MSRSSLSPLRIAIDTGGTFTDCVWTENGRIRTLKVFSTPSDPSLAILHALEKIRPSRTFILLHGTTVGTNSLLQRKGGRVALVTTAGFEDVIEIGRQARPKLYDFFFDKSEPLVPCELRFGVSERTDAEGNILEAPSAQELSALVETITDARPQATAISFLFSFANPQNERAVTQALRKLGLPVSVSHEILPEFREYERTSTVVVNAYLQPIMQAYLEQLESRARAWSHSPPDKRGSDDTAVFVMQSSGGITAARGAAREPVRTVLSGPAGGVVGAAASAQRSGVEHIISFDMGGTSTDVALVDREPRAGSQREVAGLAVGIPMLDIHTVGAGGGSIARFDAAGALRVGPESAGAEPGPICYGRGLQPTVTDANLLLGRLRPDRFLGGEFALDPERTRRIVRDWLKANRSHLTVEQFAHGVIRVVNSTMEKAIRVVSIERGFDSREFSLVAFGGAGGLHACELADVLGIPKVIVPALPGALSAFGILVSDIVKDYSRTVLWRTKKEFPGAKLEREYAKLRRAAERDFTEERWHGRIAYSPSIDVRYRGQGYELNLPFTPNVLPAFHEEHERRYGYRQADAEVELVTVRLRAKLRSPSLNLNPPSAPLRTDNPIDRAQVMFGGKRVSTAIYDRESLSPLRKYTGPAIVTEYSATTAVPPGMRFWLDRATNLIIEVKRKRYRSQR
jgi:N-methylhydantoinase A